MKPIVKTLYGLFIGLLLVSLPGLQPGQLSWQQPAYAAVPLVSASQDSVELTATVDSTLDLSRFPVIGNFTVHFNHPMDPESTQAPVLTFPYTAGKSTWDITRQTLVFIPDAPLQGGHSYTFFVDPALRTVEGLQFTRTPQWSVQVEAPPRVVSVTPVTGLITTRRPNLMINFDRPMQPERTLQAFSVQPKLKYTGSWKSEKQLSITLDEPLTPGELYHFMLSAAAVDVNGAPLEEGYRWSYWLAPFTTRVEVKDKQRVQVIYNYNLDPIKTGVPYTLTVPLAGKWEWFSPGILQFNTQEPIPAGVRFSFKQIKNLVDSMGDPLTAAEKELRFSARPPITSYLPSAQEVYDPTDIEIYFSTVVDHASVEKAFTITPAMEGVFSWKTDPDSKYDHMIFDPTDDFIRYESYSVSLGVEARDAQGKIFLAEPFSWKFRTMFLRGGVYIDGAAFGDYGPNIQVVDADGPRWIQFGIAEKKVDLTPVQLALYEYELGEFVQLYTQYYSLRKYDRGKSIPIPEGKEPSAQWTQEVSNLYVQQATIPDDVPTGMYVLTLSRSGVDEDQLFLVLTRNTLVVKRSGKELFTWLSDINGESLPDTEVRLYSSRGEEIREGNTGTDGVYRTTVPEGYTPLLVVARTGTGDYTVSGLDYAWQTEGGYYWGWENSERTTHRYRAYIYTDRPIYRPGQTVYFKAILRGDDDVRFSLPPVSSPLTARLKDDRENSVQTLELQTGDYGTVDGAFALAEGAMLGNYTIEVTYEGETFSQALKVQDYRKPDILIKLGSTRDTYIRGDELVLDIDVSYFYGEPVADASLTVHQYQLYQHSYGWDWENTGEYDWYFTRSVAQDRKTDNNGKYQLDLQTETYDAGCWRRKNSACSTVWALEVNVNDGSNQYVSASYIYRVYASGEILWLDTGGYFKKPQQEFDATVLVKDLEDKPVNERQVDLSIKAWDRKTYEFTTIYSQVSGKTDANGQVTFPLKLENEGYYQVQINSKDGKGNPGEYSRGVYVHAERQSWMLTSREHLTIQSEKEAYAPYQTARFMVESDFSGPALLTFERGHVVHYKLVDLTAPLTLVEAQIIPEDAPNIFVKIAAWQEEPAVITNDIWGNTSRPDSRLHSASLELLVDSSTKALQVNLGSDQPIYQPRQEAVFTVDVKDAQGNPVRAEVSLALVDEAVFSLSGELSAPILQAFYGRRELQVSTYDSLSPSRHIFLGEFGQGGGGGDYPVSPRSNFPDTVLWLPAVQTDVHGQAQVKVTLPDSLTSWRLTAKAVTRSTLVGEAALNVLTQQEVVLQPALPRVLTSGDQADITTLVHNYADAPRELQVGLQSTGLAVQGSLTQTVELDPGGTRVLTWKVTVEASTDTDISFTASQGARTADAVRLPLHIQPAAVPGVDSQVGTFNGALDIPLALPIVVLEQSEVQVLLGRSPASSLRHGLEYLVGYPYGCVEQTMSRALPTAVVGRLLEQLGLEDDSLSEEIDPMIQASIQRLFGYQHYDGGWGWWYDDASDDYQTAWVLFGLAVTAEAGYEVDQDVLKDAADFLLDKFMDMDPRTQAFSLYSLARAGFGDVEKSLALVKNTQTLDPFSQAALALALHELEEHEQAQVMLAALAGTAVVQDEMVYWPRMTGDGYYRKTMASTIRSTALALDAFTLIDPENPLILGMVRYLMAQRQPHGWGSTNETAFTILALTDHLLTLEQENAQVPYQVLLNGRVVAQGTFADSQAGVGVTLPANQLEPGRNLLRLVTGEGAALYYQVNSRFYLPIEHVEASGNVSVTRQYLDPKNNQPLKDIKMGQLVRVQLKLKFTAGTSFVMIEDHLPGGLEALNESLNTTTQGGDFDIYGYSRSYWQEYGYNNKEVFGDRVTFFITEVGSGEVTLTYLGRATTAGVFTALPTEVSAMYDAAIWGHSASDVLTVEP